MTEIMDEEIRRALAAEALAYEPPEDLAAKTLSAAESAGTPGPIQRIRGWVESRKVRRRGEVPKWAFAGMAMAILFGLYGVGSMFVPDASKPQGADEASNALAPGEQPPDSSQRVDRGSLPSSAEAEGDRALPSMSNCEGGNCPGFVGEGAQEKAAQPGARPGGNGGSGGNAGSGDEGRSGAIQAQGRAGSPPMDAVGPGPGPIPGPVPNAASGPGVIRTGEMEVRVRKNGFGSAWARAMNVASKHGGFVASSSADQVKGRLSRGTLTVRVPAANLDAAVADFQRLGKLVRSTSSSSDVSGQLVDFDARIRAAQARELQLLELLRQARSVADSLQVGTALSEVRTEIERLQAERANLQSQVELASLTVSLYEPQAAPEAPRPLEGRLGTAWERALDAGALTLSTIVIGAGFVLPLVVLGLMVWGGIRLRRRVALR